MSHKHSRSHHSETNSAASIATDEESIRMRAYQLYEERGREDGRDLEDWFRAEAEIVGTESGGETKLQEVAMEAVA